MTSITITWIYEPQDSQRFHLGRDHEFVADLGRHAGISIPLLEGPLHDLAPAEGFILLNSPQVTQSLAACPLDRQADLASRLVPLDISSSHIFDLLENLSLPAAVDVASHLKWKESDRTNIGAYGPYGLRDVGAVVGAACAPRREMSGGAPASQDESVRYCYLHSAVHLGLPHLLADYLAALHRQRSE